MLDARRKAYLDAMGIELWRARDGALLEQPAASVESPAAAQTAADPGAQAEAPAAAARAPAVKPVEQPATEAIAGEAPPVFESIPADAYEEPPYLEDEDHDADLEPMVSPVANLDWPALAERVANCRDCALCDSRTKTVFGVGDKQASLMIIGEAPGAEEDRQGEPFVGSAGHMLSAMLQAIGLQTEQVYLANVLKCRPPDNRDPHVDEAAACRDYLNRQIALIQPKLILSVGAVSARHLLQTDESVGRLRGKIHAHPASGTPLMVTYHPAYLLRSPAEKAKSWQDLQQVWQKLREAAE